MIIKYDDYKYYNTSTKLYWLVYGESGNLPVSDLDRVPKRGVQREVFWEWYVPLGAHGVPLFKTLLAIVQNERSQVRHHAGW